MRIDRSEIVKGMIIEGAPHRAFTRRDMVRKGMFLTGGDCPAAFIRSAPPTTADEIAAKLDSIRERLAALAASVRSR